MSFQESRRELGRIEDEGDKHLFAIRSSFSGIVKYGHGKNDLYVVHILRQMESLAAVANDAANSGELRVIGHHFTSA